MKHLLASIFMLLTLAFLFSCSGSDGSDGLAGADGMDGIAGADGADGITPICDDATNTWHIETIDTEIKCVSLNGKDGKDGTNGADGENGKDGADGVNGSDGQSCDTAEDGAYFVMKCGGVEKARWAKAMCGTVAYDPDTHVCKKGILMSKCGDEIYNPSTQFCDTRDDQIYKWVKIGTQTWMAENLNYSASGSVCYDNYPGNCDTYGRLYNWSTAMDDVASSSATPSGVQGVCPDGWHLPSDTEWEVLVKYVDTSATGDNINVSGRHLKAKDGWYACGPSGSGRSYLCEDDYGFSALPGGYGYIGSFNNVGSGGYWWSSTEYNASNAYRRGIAYDSERVFRYYIGKSNLYSVRCVQDWSAD